jgi:hypothetical protein
MFASINSAMASFKSRNIAMADRIRFHRQFFAKFISRLIKYVNRGFTILETRVIEFNNQVVDIQLEQHLPPSYLDLIMMTKPEVELDYLVSTR